MGISKYSFPMILVFLSVTLLKSCLDPGIGVVIETETVPVTSPVTSFVKYGTPTFGIDFKKWVSSDFPVTSWGYLSGWLFDRDAQLSP